jgi:acyl carrier protein
VTEETTPVDIDEWDSLAHVSLLATLENTFDIRFTADDMGIIDSVAAHLTVLEERGAK